MNGQAVQGTERQTIAHSVIAKKSLVHQSVNIEVNIMGFWKNVSSIVQGVAEQMDKTGNELKALKMKLEEKDSKKLEEIAKEDGFFSSSRERAMAVKILKERGDYKG